MVKTQRLFAKTNLKIRVCEAMKAPVGLLSDRTVCESRWRGLAPTSSSLSYTFLAGFGVGPRLRSAAMKAPVGLLSGSAVCDSRWRGVAPTSMLQQEHFGNSQELEKRSSGWPCAARGQEPSTSIGGSFCFAGALRDGVVYSAQFNNSEFMEENMQGERKTLTQLSVPICLETLFYMLSGMVDTLMLSSVSDQAVGAVGTANTYIGVFIIMFGVISSGMVAVMSQNIGAGRPGIAYQARQLGLVFNALTGILISVVLAVFSGGILRAVSIAPALLESAETYLKIVGGASFLNALIPIFSSYLRVFGYTKHSLTGTVVGNVINIILNSVFLFVFHWGVMGVATATVISKAVNLIIVAAMGAVLIKAKQSPEREQPRRILAQIVKIGFPSAFETALYNVAMTFIVRFMNQMDTDGMNVTARSYAMQIANFSYCVGAALAQANAIMTGWRIGAKKYEECDRGTRKAVIYGLVTATCFSVTFAMTGRFIVHIFTDDTQMIELVVKLLIVDIFLEFGRVTNLVYGQALKTSGDAIFPVIIGAIFMYLFAVGGTYFLGIHMGLLAVGAYIAMAGDECARAIGMVLRWKSGKWKSKSLIEL